MEGARLYLTDFPREESCMLQDDSPAQHLQRQISIMKCSHTCPTTMRGLYSSTSSATTVSRNYTGLQLFLWLRRAILPEYNVFELSRLPRIPCNMLKKHHSGRS